MLTVREAPLDKIRALDLGADDYLTKPFDHLELLARLRALLRRSTMMSAEQNPVLDSAEFSRNPNTREVRVNGEVVRLTSTEYRLLEELARHPGVVLPHHYLLQQVWGSEYVGEDHYLKVFVGRLRHKLGDDADQPRYIQTEWGIGYRFIPPQ
jgi:DNA-binding response OmpR family regulator